MTNEEFRKKAQQAVKEARATTPEDTELRKQIAELFNRTSNLKSQSRSDNISEAINLITLHTREAELEGHIHAAVALKKRAELLGGTPEYMLNQFDVHIKASIAHLTNPTEEGGL